MDSFLILGLIPGTNIQISFWAWVIITALSLIGFKLYRKRITNYLVTFWNDLDRIDSRRPLHANQLHSRLHLTVR